MITISTMEKIVTALSTVGNERMFDRLMLPESRPADGEDLRHLVEYTDRLEQQPQEQHGDDLDDGTGE